MNVGHQGDYSIDVWHKREQWRRNKTNKTAKLMAIKELYPPEHRISSNFGVGVLDQVATPRAAIKEAATIPCGSLAVTIPLAKTSRTST